MRKLTLWQAVAISTQFGFLLAVSVLVGTGLGWFIGQWLGVGVIGMFVGAMIGLISGVYSVVKLVRSFMGSGNPPD